MGLVAGKAARHKSGAQFDCQACQVDGFVEVVFALPALRVLVVGRRELALCKTVCAVVFNNVGHVEPATDGVTELAQADGCGISVSGNADINQIVVGQVGAGRHRGHPAVHPVKSVGTAQEVGSGFRGATDTGQFGYPVGGHITLETGLDDGCSDGIVAASSTQGRDDTLIVAPGETEIVYRQGSDGGIRVLRCGSWQIVSVRRSLVQAAVIGGALAEAT